MPIVKLSRQGRLMIPAELCHELGLRQGTELLLSPDGHGGLRLRPLPAVPPLGELVGSLKPAHPVDVKAARRAGREEVAARFAEETTRISERGAPPSR